MSVSMNIKISSFADMNELNPDNSTYQMRVKLENDPNLNEKLILYSIKIYEFKENAGVNAAVNSGDIHPEPWVLILSATHLKKIINSKF